VNVEEALAQIDRAVSAANEVADPLSELTGSPSKLSEAITICASTIERLVTPDSTYAKQAKRTLDRNGASLVFYANQLQGILEALRSDISAGYLRTIVEEVHADVFSDFLEMADHLVGENLALPAAVVAGAALESHLRALAERAQLPTQARGRPKRAAQLNDDLLKREIYRKAEHKQVLAWQDLRNSAAHGEADFDPKQIRLMVQGIRDFIARHPA
jgi:hypothetical protein